MMRFFSLVLFSVFFAAKILAVDSYEVQFEGITRQETLDLLQSVSQSVKLKNSPPPTNAGLKRRAEADIPNFVKVLHSQAYYNAQIDYEIDFKTDPTQIYFKVIEGPIYPINRFTIIPVSSDDGFPYEEILLDDLGICLGDPALPKTILEAKEYLNEYMANKSYPLFTIHEQKVIANQQTKSVDVILKVDSGPSCVFGQVAIQGNQNVCSDFFNKKIAWLAGDTYDPCLIEKTQREIEATGLFSNVAISNATHTVNGTEIPITLEVVEDKHRSIGAGLSYTTELGPGLVAEWEHRNFCGMGERLSLKTGLWSRYQDGIIRYLKPDFLQRKQDLILTTEFQHEKTDAFSAHTVNVSAIIERQLTDCTRISFGGMYTHLLDTHSDNNRTFNLLKAPMQLRWTNANNLLDPTDGQVFHFKIVPSVQIIHPKFGYCVGTFIGSFYQPLTCDHEWVFATKITLGSILGSARRTIPPSERFYAGSESLLRGYRYLRVSPLGKHRRPIGGRSMMIYSFELRWRQTETLGWVIFYEVGNVYAEIFPKINHKVLQSTGLGFRYHTPVGPLRLDLAFPLNPRKHVDHHYQIYLSVGQAF
jgi:translocation and assembly module TamA